MSFFQLLKKWLRGSCVWFTLITLILLCAGALAGSELSFLETSAFLLFFPFALCMSAAGMLIRYERVARWIRWLSHYVITVIAVLLFILLPNGQASAMKPSFVLIMLVLLTIVYWILFAIIHILYKHFKKLWEED